MDIVVESDLEIICAGCGAEHDQIFESSWDQRSSKAHYLNTTCNSCGYEISIKTGDCSGY